MKAILWSLLIVSWVVNSNAQDITTALGFQVIDVPAGKVCEILNFSGPVKVRKDADSPECFISSDNNNSWIKSLPLAQAFPIAGPALISVGTSTTYTAVLTYRMKDNTSSSTTTPTSAVVIPTDATGPVKIILESSTDLVTWTEANPGTYGASTSKRFYRVRAVNQ